MTRSAEAGKPGRFIGAGIPMKTNRILVAGKGTYIADIDIPGTLHMAVVRSPYAHAFVFDEATGAVHVAKVPSTPQNPDLAVLDSIAAAGLDPRELTLITHGTTVATNALITRRLPRAAMITTRGFHDVVEIRDGTKNELWDAYGRGFFFGASGAGGASRLRAFRCHVLRADRRAHLGEQPLRLAQLALTSRRIASELRQPGALDVDERREGARAGDLHERRRLVQRGADSWRRIGTLGREKAASVSEVRACLRQRSTEASGQGEGGFGRGEGRRGVPGAELCLGEKGGRVRLDQGRRVQLTEGCEDRRQRLDRFMPPAVCDICVPERAERERTQPFAAAGFGALDRPARVHQRLLGLAQELARHHLAELGERQQIAIPPFARQLDRLLHRSGTVRGAAEIGERVAALDEQQAVRALAWLALQLGAAAAEHQRLVARRERFPQASCDDEGSRQRHASQEAKKRTTRPVGEPKALPEMDVRLVNPARKRERVGIDVEEPYARPRIFQPRRPRHALGEERRGVLTGADGDAADEVPARAHVERERLLGLRGRRQKLAYPPPVAYHLTPITHGEPVRGTLVPAGSHEGLARTLPVMGQECRALREPIGIQGLDGARDRAMSPRTPLGELRVVGDLLRQRVLEGVLDLRIEGRLEQELARNERPDGGGELVLREIRDAPQHRIRQLAADHRRGLEHGFLALRQPVDASRQDGLDRGRDRELLHGSHEPIGAPRPDQGFRLDERLHHLLDEEGISAGALGETLGQWHDRRIAAEQITQQLGESLGAEGLERELPILWALHPRRAVAGAECRQPERRRVRSELFECGEHRVTCRVEPV